MEKQAQSKRLILVLLMLSGGAIMGIVNLADNYMDFSDFQMGFIDGISLTLSAFGFILFLISLVKHRRI